MIKTLPALVTEVRSSYLANNRMTDTSSGLKMILNMMLFGSVFHCGSTFIHK